MLEGATAAASPSSIVPPAPSPASSTRTTALLLLLLPLLPPLRRRLALSAIPRGIPPALGLSLGHPLFFVVAVVNLIGVQLLVVEVGRVAALPTELDDMGRIDERDLIPYEVNVDVGMATKELGVLPVFRPRVGIFLLRSQWFDFRGSITIILRCGRRLRRWHSSRQIPRRKQPDGVERLLHRAKDLEHPPQGDDGTGLAARATTSDIAGIATAIGSAIGIAINIASRSAVAANHQQAALAERARRERHHAQSTLHDDGPFLDQMVLDPSGGA